MSLSYVSNRPKGLRLLRPGHEIFVAVFPFYHIAGLAVCVVNGFCLGSTIITYPTFEWTQFLEANEKNKVSINIMQYVKI